MISARPRILIKVTFLKKFALEVWVSIFSYPSVLTYDLSARNDRLIETFFEYPQHMFWLRNKK